MAVFHQVGHAQGRRATHAGFAVHQGAASVRCCQLDFVRHPVEVVTERSQRGVGDRDVDVLHAGELRGSAFGLADVDHARYFAAGQLAGVFGRSDIAEVQVFRDRAQARQSRGGRRDFAAEQTHRTGAATHHVSMWTEQDKRDPNWLSAIKYC